MLIYLLSQIQSTGDKSAYFLLATTALLLANKGIVKKVKTNFLLKFLLKKITKKKSGGRRPGPLTVFLLALIGGTLLLGLLFGWTVTLWVLLGLVVCAIIALIAKKPTSLKLLNQETKN